jgi:hypothetical protein
MPQIVNAVTMIATKLASGNVQMVFQNAVGGIMFSVVIPSADFTTLNSSVNGGLTGAAVTKQYQQDMNKNDYPGQSSHPEGN